MSKFVNNNKKLLKAGYCVDEVRTQTHIPYITAYINLKEKNFKIFQEINLNNVESFVKIYRIDSFGIEQFNSLN